MTLDEIEKKISKVHSLNTKEEREAFYRYASNIPDNGIIVDIGTCAGSSAFIFALASKPSVKVYTIDPVMNPSFMTNMKEFGLESKIVFLQETSEQVALKWDKPIDLLFIDGIHSYLGVSNDFNWFKDHMTDGGVVMFHDYYLYCNTIGKAIDEIVMNDLAKELEIIDSKYKDEIRTGLYITTINK